MASAASKQCPQSFHGWPDKSRPAAGSPHEPGRSPGGVSSGDPAASRRQPTATVRRATVWRMTSYEDPSGVPTGNAKARAGLVPSPDANLELPS